MQNTFDKLKINELIELYEKLLLKLNEYRPDSQDYFIVEEKLRNIEDVIQKKRPNYFKQKEDIEIMESVLNDNYDIFTVAKIFKVTRQTIYNWINDGKVKALKIGKTSYIPKTEVDRISKDGI